MECNARFGWCDSLLSYPTLVGHIHLNKYLDSTSLLARLLVIHDSFFYCTFELMSLCTCYFMWRFKSFFLSLARVWTRFLFIN
jgi:hypothetical protein